jgi:hypothetical protein
MTYLRSVFLIVLALTLVRSADAQKPDTDTLAPKIRLAEGSARRWLGLVDSARYSASWNSAAASFRSQVSQSEWLAAASAARGEVDPLGARRLLSAHYTRELPDAPPGEYVVLQYSTAARNSTRVVETITLTLEGKRTWRVIGYFIRPE